MAIASGIGGFCAIKAETTYGTPVTPDQSVEVNTAQLKKIKNTAQGRGLASGLLGARGVRRKVTTNAGAGTIGLDVTSNSMGRFLQMTMGATAAPVQIGGTAAYTQTHTMSDNIGKFATIQVGIPDAGGTIRPNTFTSCKVLQADFHCGIDEILQATYTIDAQTMLTATAAITPSYVAAATPFSFAEMTVKLGTFNSEASVTGVRAVDLSFSRSQKADRFYAGAAGLKAEPIMNDYVAITGTLEIDYTTVADFVTRFITDTPTSMVVTFVQPVAIAAANFPTITFQIPNVYFDGDTPTLDGPDMVGLSIPFQWLYDNTNLPSITMISSDTAL